MLPDTEVKKRWRGFFRALVIEKVARAVTVLLSPCSRNKSCGMDDVLPLIN